MHSQTLLTGHSTLTSPVRRFIGIVCAQDNSVTHSNTITKGLVHQVILNRGTHPKDVIVKWKPSFMGEDVNYVIITVAKDGK